MDLLKRINALSKLGMGAILITLIFVLSFLSPVFLTSANLFNVLLQVSINTIVAMGMTFVILTAGIDLSIGSTVAVSAVSLGTFLHKGMAWAGSEASWAILFLISAIAIIAALAVGGICGWLNGFAVAYCRVPPFIATLGSMSILRGLALIITQGKTLYTFPAPFRWLGSGYIGPVPVPVIIALFVTLLSLYITTQTRFGRHIYATGGNREAVRLSGIDVSKVELWAYTIGGLTAGLGAVVLVGRLNSAQPIAGTGYEMEAIAAVVIGGTSLAGGVGGVWGTLMGALILGILQNGLTLMNISSYSQRLIIGIVIIAAVFFDQIRHGHTQELMRLWKTLKKFRRGKGETYE